MLRGRIGTQRERGKKKKSATAHLRTNMIYDLAGELHVMIERVDQGVCAIQKDCGEAENRQRCRSIAPHPPSASRVPATLSRGYGLRSASTSLPNHRAAPAPVDGARGEFIPLKVDLLLLS